MKIDVEEVNRLLQASRAAHERKKRTAGVIDREGRVVAAPNWPAAELHIVEALKLRLQAHDLDPEHTAAGWNIPIPPAQVATSDAALISFYVQYARPFIQKDHLAEVIARFPEAADENHPKWKYIP